MSYRPSVDHQVNDTVVLSHVTISYVSGRVYHATLAKLLSLNVLLTLFLKRGAAIAFTITNWSVSIFYALYIVIWKRYEGLWSGKSFNFSRRLSRSIAYPNFFYLL